MLVLTRKYQEKIRIGENITITVLRMKGKAVRLGIEAPANVPVVRGELAFAVESATEADVTAEGEEVDQEPADEFPSRGRQFARIAAAGGEWGTDSNPAEVARAGNARITENIKFGRVRRGQVAEVLPKLVGGAAPLRAMMGRQ